MSLKKEKYNLLIRIFSGLLLGIAMGVYYAVLFLIMTIGVVPFCIIYAIYLQATGKWQVEDVLRPGKIVQDLWRQRN